MNPALAGILFCYARCMRTSWILVSAIVAGYVLLLLALVFALHSNGHDLSYFSVGSGGDAYEYNQLGLSILETGRFELAPSQPEFFRTPGHPMMLALVYAIARSVYAVVIVQIALVALCAWLIAEIGKRIGYPKVGIGAALLFACNPVAIVGVFMTLSDILFVTVLLLCVYLCLRKSKNSWLDAALLGVLLGYLTLVRPLGMFVVPIFAAWFVVVRWGIITTKEKSLYVGAIVACAVFVVAPWVWRNYSLAGVATVSSASGYNMLFYNFAEFEVAQGQGTKDEVRTRLNSLAGSQSTAELRDLSYAANIQKVTKAELEGKVIQYAQFHILKSIPYYISSSIEAAKRAFSLQGVLPHLQLTYVNISGLVLNGHYADAVTALVRDPWILLERLYWVLVLLLDIAALLLTRGKTRVTIIFFALIALAFGILTGPVSFPRYRLPAEPFMLLAAGVGLAGLAQLPVFSKLQVWKKRIS